MLREIKYELQRSHISRVIDGVKVLTANYSDNEMPYVGLVELLFLPINNSASYVNEV